MARTNMSAASLHSKVDIASLTVLIYQGNNAVKPLSLSFLPSIACDAVAGS